MELGRNHEEQILEVYSNFGIAMYQAQCLERELAIALATVYSNTDNDDISGENIHLLLNINFKQTLGQLINRMRKTVKISAEFQAKLEKSLTMRNCLVHQYFWDRAGHFLTIKGRNSMISELRKITMFLDEVDRQLAQIDRDWATANGITEEMRQKALAELIRKSENQYFKLEKNHG